MIKKILSKIKILIKRIIMTLSFNGNILDVGNGKVTYNGTELDKLQLNGVTIWEKQSSITITNYFSLGYYKSGDTFIYSGNPAFFNGYVAGNTTVSARDVYPTNFETENWIFSRESPTSHFIGINYNIADYGLTATGYGFSVSQSKGYITYVQGDGNYNSIEVVAYGDQEPGTNFYRYYMGFKRLNGNLWYYSLWPSYPEYVSQTQLPVVWDFSSNQNNAFISNGNSGALLTQKYKSIRDLDTDIKLENDGIGTQLNFDSIKTIKNITFDVVNSSASMQISYNPSVDGTTFTGWQTTTNETNINVQASKLKLKIENTSHTNTTNFSNVKINF